MEYTLQLVEEKVKTHQVTALHLTCALAFIGAGAIVYIYNDTIKPWGLALLALGFALIILTIVKNKMVTTTGNLIFRMAELFIAGTFAIYSAVQQWHLPTGIFGVLTAGVAFAIFWERQANSIQYVSINEAGIKLPFESRKNSLEWTEVDKVLLRFGTLSIDCIGNRLFQWNVIETGFTPGELEAFSKTQIEGNRSKRRNDDW